MHANPVSYFEIPVLDMPRARAFYERVFQTRLSLAEIDGHPMALFPAADGAPGASGALAMGESYRPGASGPRLYFSVDDIDATLAAALAAGAQPHYPVTEVPGTGWVAEFLDLDGNCIALYAPQRAAGGAA